MKKVNFLLTDALPYEIPLLYSNSMFAEHIAQTATAVVWNDSELAKKIDYSVPFQFYVWKNDKSKRKLDLLHPLSQLQMYRFVELYEHELVNYCNNYAIFSLRYPSGINSLELRFENKIKREIEFVLEENYEFQNNEFEFFVDSYFEKKKFKKITQFYSSNLFKNLETKYSMLKKLDIKNCFDNIYTHSIDWAFLGDKEWAKKLIREDNRFSAILDKLMQAANYNETNGIVVGPEFSRLVAEIVLMRIDYLVYKKLQEKGIQYKNDYDVVRYIDDIFIFCNDMSISNKIQELYEEVCKYYKLDLNEAKTHTERRPFLRKGTWVTKMRATMDNFFVKFYKLFEDTEGQQISLTRNDFSKPNIRLIDDMRSIIVDYESEDEKIISYLFTSFEKQLKRIFHNIKKLDEHSQTLLLFSLIDVLHYSLVFSITSPHILRYVMFMTKVLSYAKSNDMIEVENILFKKCLELLRYNSNKNMELLNLIIFMRRIRKDIPEDLLIQYLSLDSGYFTLSSVMYYISADDKKYRYKRVKNLINKTVGDLADSVMEKYFGAGYNDKIAKSFIVGDCFYPIHDFYNHPLLTAQVNRKIRDIKTILNNFNWNNQNIYFRTFWEYAKDFNKPFMKFSISDKDLVPLIILKSSNQFEPRISG